MFETRPAAAQGEVRQTCDQSKIIWHQLDARSKTTWCSVLKMARIKMCDFYKVYCECVGGKGGFSLLVFNSSEFVKTDWQGSIGRSIGASLDLFLSHFFTTCFYILITPREVNQQAFLSSYCWIKILTLFMLRIDYQRVKTRKKLYNFCRSTIQVSWSDRLFCGECLKTKILADYELFKKLKRNVGALRALGAWTLAAVATIAVAFAVAFLAEKLRRQPFVSCWLQFAISGWVHPFPSTWYLRADQIKSFIIVSSNWGTAGARIKC